MKCESSLFSSKSITLKLFFTATLNITLAILQIDQKQESPIPGYRCPEKFWSIQEKIVLDCPGIFLIFKNIVK